MVLNQFKRFFIGKPKISELIFGYFHTYIQFFAAQFGIVQYIAKDIKIKGETE